MALTQALRRTPLAALALIAVAFPLPATAQTAQEQAFFEQMFAICNDLGSFTGPGDPLINTCNNVFTGGLSGGTFSAGSLSSNIGGAASYGSTGRAGAQPQQREIERRREDEDGDGRRGGGAGDFTAGPFGGFVSAQTSRSERQLTDLENGFKADLAGIVIGLDRRFGDELIAGVSVGHSRTDSTYLGNSGTLDASATQLMFYATYLPAPGYHLGGYLGGGTGSQDSTRQVRVVDPVGSTVLVSGTTASTTDSTMAMYGLSGGRSWDGDALSVGLSAAIDYVQNRSDATQESGSTGLELSFPEQTTRSLSASLGLRASYRKATDWGALVPAIRATYFHEFRDDARILSPTFAGRPNLAFTFATDQPDRDYYVAGAALTLESGSGTQWFVDYESRSGHRYVDTWAASLGLVTEF